MTVPDVPDRARLASGRGVDVVAASSSLRSLAEVLQPGEVVSGRVVDRFANGDYLFALRGRTLVASSAVPLATDTVVSFEVMPGDGGAIRLRIAPDAAAPASAPAEAPTPADLGLADDATTRLALQAFAKADAPLDRARLQAAATALANAPAAARAALADALAALAAHDLPATAALVSLAQRALAGPPRAAAALAAAAAAFAAVPSAELRPAADALADDARATAATGGASGDTREPALAATSPGARGDTASTPAPTSAGLAMAATTRVADAPAATMPSASPVSPTPDASPTAIDRVPLGTAAPRGDDAAARAAATATMPAAAGAVSGAAVVDTARADVALRALVDLLPLPLPPDAGRDGAAAVRAALALVGVRSDDALGGDTAASPSSAASRGDDAASAARPPAAPAQPSTAPATNADAPALRAAGTQPLLPRLAAAARALGDARAPEARTALAAIAGAAREVAGETTLKPPALADYDVVLPLPLTAYGEPTPARLAIARRASASGVVATFLRVDVELSRLGRVSARLSGIVGGPLSVTIIAGDAARASLAPGVAALEADLAARGAPARVRLVDPSESGDG